VDVAAFDYGLPPERIAQHPLPERDAARLLVDGGPGVPPGHRHVRDLPDLLRPGDVMVLNRTRVLPARVQLRKPSGGVVEVLLVEHRGGGCWEALVRGSRRVSPGTRLTADSDPTFAVEVHDDLGEGRRLVRVDADDELAALERHGVMPLPPYITEPLATPERYQTVFADSPESVAAPTAGLHLTDEVLARCRSRDVDVQFVDLAIGLDTFRPMTTDVVEDHAMHGEQYRVPEATWAACETATRVVAVGTTVVRALESAAATGELDGRTQLFIHGEYPFQMIDLLLTNFHLPRSSLLVLIDAFVGPRWRSLYEHALANDFRFLSFGDAMLLTRRGATGA
jgi:S-adenosylmethionine:tRNA ribosyltransferase-isomerase